VLTIAAFHSASDFLHRLASAVALAGEMFNHVGLAGLFARADAAAAQDIHGAGGRLVEFHGIAQGFERTTMTHEH
jgi:hypothetical protein